jgi:hypothetical protein
MIPFDATESTVEELSRGTRDDAAPLWLAGPAPCLRSFALSAVAECAVSIGTEPSSKPELQYLADHRCYAGDESLPRALDAYLRHPVPADLPLFELAANLDLSVAELLAVSLAVAVDMDPMVGRVLAFVQAPVGGSRPTLGLLATALEPVTRNNDLLGMLATGKAVQSGLLTLLSDNAPLPERSVTVPLPLVRALSGADAGWPAIRIGAADGAALDLAESVQQKGLHLARGLRAFPGGGLTIRCASMPEGRALAQTIAVAMQMRPAFIDGEIPSGLEPWLIARRLLPVFSLNLGPGERKELHAFRYYRGPAIAICGLEGSVTSSDRAWPDCVIGVPERAEREMLWGKVLGDKTLSAELAREFRHGAGRIAQLARVANQLRAADGRARLTVDDIRQSAWTSDSLSLDGLAVPMRERITDEALIVAKPIREQLELLLARCRVRDHLADGLGVSATTRYRAGVRGLFVGPSGTGKSLAVQWLAAKLGMPLYRVDLAAITSKWIGETEKNLAQLLARAEHSDVMLLFDEADSLFGKRTDVKEANDRFANAQTNYLLQRIETFDGVVMLTSNSRTRFDSAFTRRLDVIIDFPMPGPEERRALWLSHLGTSHCLGMLQLNQIAAAVDLGGGHIRNVALAAAVFAKSNGREITYADLVCGLESEYRKLGRLLPPELSTNLVDRRSVL